jgi:GNAT superfamily N-acetyltransferase
VVANPVAWVVEADELVAGYAFGREWAGHIAHLDSISVHALYRDRGLDRLLTRAAFESALRGGCVKVVLHDLPLAAWFGLVENLGYVFDRRYDGGGDVRLEFYLNLYATQTTDAADSDTAS